MAAVMASVRTAMVPTSRQDAGGPKYEESVLKLAVGYRPEECASEQVWSWRCSLYSKKVKRHGDLVLRPNVRAKLPAEAGAVSPGCDDAPCAADRAYSACRSGSA
jgi:hypothetical protein